MMAKYAQGTFIPANPEKYVGKGTIIYRSSWEMVMMRFLDTNPNVLQWASESIQIPYRNPLTGKSTIYVPDFFMYYQDADGNKHGELIEVKPSKEMAMENARSARDKAMVAVNMAKWAAARAFCAQMGIKFRVLCESDIFHQGKKR